MLKDPQDADDITQDTFLKLLTFSGGFESEAHVKNWLIRVAVNGCKNNFRARWRRHESLDGYAETLGFESREQSDLFRAVESLDRKHRIVIHLHYYEGYSMKEIAELLGISENTVSTRLYRARTKLKKMMTEV